MIIILKRRQCAVAGAVGFLLFFSSFAALLWFGHRPESVEAAATTYVPEGPKWVIDAGHGGDDGGAVSPDGTVESSINLAIVLRLNDLMHFAGQQTILTRSDENSLSDEGLATIRERKVSDLHNRVDLINATEGAILLSIHQNSLPTSPQTRGAQVFWNQEAGAQELAQGIQNRLNAVVNAPQEKEASPMASDVYLMANATAPGALVECGFLSNVEETAMLRQSAYQTKLAITIMSGALDWARGEEEIS